MIVSLLGLPGAGKSTLARALGEVLGALVLAEPEESAWPHFVKHPHRYGDFTRLSWFRAQRVPLYYEAAKVRDGGGRAVLDSYYDKLCAGWLGKPGLEWLMQPDDPYFSLAMGVAKVDEALLPAADVVVVLEISEQMWLSQIRDRGRVIDRHDPFLRSHHTQAVFVATALERSPLHGTAVVRHTRMPAAPLEEASEVAQKILEATASATP